MDKNLIEIGFDTSV